MHWGFLLFQLSRVLLLRWVTLFFHVDEFAIWGFLTGIFAFFPVVGTMIVWVPLVIYMYASGNTWNASGVLIYSVVITGNVDYLARMTLLRRIGDVHPVITILGVIVGLGLFGFIGLIFGHCSSVMH